MKLNVYLNFPGTTEEALEFYRSVFGGSFSSLVRFRDMPMEGVDVPDDEADRIMHVALPVGDEVLMASDSLESLGQEVVVGNNVHLSVHPTDRGEADRIFEALADGGEVEMPIADQPWGDYYGSLQDRYGIWWMVIHGAEQT